MAKKSQLARGLWARTSVIFRYMEEGMHGNLTTGSAPPPGIVVMGVFRSGTSVTCAMLEKLGVCFGPHQTMLGPEPENPLGYFQHTGIRDINGRLLRSAGGDETRPGEPGSLLARGDERLLRGNELDWRNGG